MFLHTNPPIGYLDKFQDVSHTCVLLLHALPIMCSRTGPQGTPMATTFYQPRLSKMVNISVLRNACVRRPGEPEARYLLICLKFVPLCLVGFVSKNGDSGILGPRPPSICKLHIQRHTPRPSHPKLRGLSHQSVPLQAIQSVTARSFPGHLVDNTFPNNFSHNVPGTPA